MSIRHLSCAVLVALVAPALHAQAPVITAAGDPSVLSDTIYRLAVDSSAHPNEPYVFLLDDGVVRVETDGETRRTYRQVVQVLTQSATETWGELSFGYNSDRERFTLNWARVVRPDGSVVSAQPAQEQESVAPTALSAPVYSDAKVVRVSLGGVAPGTIVDYSFTISRLRPPLPGEFEATWGVTNLDVLTRRSRYIVDVPATLEPKIRELNLTFARRASESGGRRVYTWATADVPRVEPEPFAADSNGVVQSIYVSAPISWDDVARWYAGLARDRYSLPANIDSVLSGLLHDARARDDTLRTLYQWVAQDFRYVSLDLGLGAYQPRPPAEVLATRYGDCKDKATLFIALARHLGFSVDPVLLRRLGRVQADMPTLNAFDHVIAVVEDRTPVYVDLTSDLTPYGSLPPGEPGEFALVVTSDGAGRVVTLPTEAAGANRGVARLVGEVAADGTLHGRLTLVAAGTQQYELRRSFLRPLGPSEQAAAASAIATMILPGATGDSLQAFNGHDLGAAAQVTLAINHAHVVSSPGALTLPFGNLRWPAAELAAQIEAHMPRRFPIDLAALVGHDESVTELELTLPAGWHAELPANMTAGGPFGTSSVTYTQDGRVLHMVRRMQGAGGIIPPEHAADLVAWLRTVAQDDANVVVFTHR